MLIAGRETQIDRLFSWLLFFSFYTIARWPITPLGFFSCRSPRAQDVYTYNMPGVGPLGFGGPGRLHTLPLPRAGPGPTIR